MDDEVVNPRLYRAFCLRGEGRRNIVDRVAAGKTPPFGLHLCEAQMRAPLSRYIHELIARFIGADFLVTPRIVRMHVGDLVNVAKIPSLPHNVKVESFEELADAPLSGEVRSSRVPSYPFIDVLEMLDVTRIPKRISNTFGPTITFEIKPKQGFYQKHPGIGLQYCNNCILQLEKWNSAAFEKMYDFCPLELYSGDLPRMFAALGSLIADPHRNLRIFLDGNPIHDEEAVLSRPELESLLFPNSTVQIDSLIKALCCVLAGVHDDSDAFYLRHESILATLLRAQRIDPIGLVRAREIYEQLHPNVQAELLNKNNLLLRAKSGFLTADDPRSLLERYFLAATLKDCSLMVSFRLATTPAGDPAHSHLVKVRPTPNAEPVCFNFSIRVVDLDPPRNLLNAYDRFMAGVNVIRQHPNLHKPCRI
ncbi:Inositol-pentakisphosphate 2-kinase [Aphelenchoides fujianensis]|nr:Inositol-pentakisphosphate 2-kinase [Aphelenchoides fujianensis]